MPDTPSIPHDKDTTDVDIGVDIDEDFGFSKHHVNVNGYDTPHADSPENEDDTDAAPLYWPSHVFTPFAFLERPPKEWLIVNVLGVRDLAMLFGESGTGKTFTALDFLFSCVTGRNFAGKFETTRPMTVVFATGEGQGALSNRLRAAIHYYGKECLSRLTILDMTPQLFDYTQDAGVLTMLSEWPAMVANGLVPLTPDLFVIDTMFNATEGADENTTKDMGRVFAAVRKLRDTLGCAVMLVHHTNKGGLDFRGSSSIKGEMDTMLRTQAAGKGFFQLQCAKLKDGAAWPTQAFCLVAVGDTNSVRVEWEGDATTDGDNHKSRKQQALTWLQEHGGWHTASQVANAIGEESKAIYEYLNSLVLAGDLDCKTQRPKLFASKSVSVSQYEVSPD